MVSNQKQSYRALLIFSGVWVGLVIIFALSFFEMFESPLWGRLVLAGIIGIIALFFYLGGYYYIQAEVENNKNLMIKYYNLFPVGRQFKAFKVPLQQFHHHEIKHGTAGLTSWLVLYQKMQGGIAKYPAIGLSAFGEKGRKEISEFLKKLENR
ncbi:MAG: hypothetical protein R6U46_05460 [Marinilabilia sp.]